MSDKSKVKIAFAEAVLQQLWVEGLISQQERENIARRAAEGVKSGDCCSGKRNICHVPQWHGNHSN